MRSEVTCKTKDNGRSPTTGTDSFEKEICADFSLTQINEGLSKEAKVKKNGKIVDEACEICRRTHYGVCMVQTGTTDVVY